MEESSTKIPDRLDGPDGLSIRRWLALYAAWLLALGLPALWMLRRTGVAWQELFVHPGQFTTPADGVLKLLIFGFYISLCCTFLPLPTGWLVSALAMRDVALTASLTMTTLTIAGIGAAASTVANLHDYHLFTWMLRHHRIARLRDTRLVHASGRWFARQPFAILVVFNIIPIPIDVIRMLAATARYPLGPFAAANFIGRWVRYAVIAAVTYLMGDRGWLISVALLAVAVVGGLARLVARRLARRGGSGTGGRDAATM